MKTIWKKYHSLAEVKHIFTTLNCCFKWLSGHLCYVYYLFASESMPRCNPKPPHGSKVKIPLKSIHHWRNLPKKMHLGGKQKQI